MIVTIISKMAEKRLRSEVISNAKLGVPRTSLIWLIFKSLYKLCQPSGYARYIPLDGTFHCVFSGTYVSDLTE